MISEICVVMSFERKYPSNKNVFLCRSEAWASLSRLGAGQYALSLVADPESSQVYRKPEIGLGSYKWHLPFSGSGGADCGFLKITRLTLALNDRLYCITK